jgi:hypothetical protein
MPDLASEEAISAHIETFSGDDLPLTMETSDHLPVSARFRMNEKFKDRQ